MFAERPPAQHVDAERLEVRGADDLIVRRRHPRLLDGRITGNGEALADVPAVERQAAAEGGALHARNGRQLALARLIERQQLLDCSCTDSAEGPPAESARVPTESQDRSHSTRAASGRAIPHPPAAALPRRPRRRRARRGYHRRSWWIHVRPRTSSPPAARRRPAMPERFRRAAPCRGSASAAISATRPSKVNTIACGNVPRGITGARPEPSPSRSQFHKRRQPTPAARSPSAVAARCAAGCRRGPRGRRFHANGRARAPAAGSRHSRTP